MELFTVVFILITMPFWLQFVLWVIGWCIALGLTFFLWSTMLYVQYIEQQKQRVLYEQRLDFVLSSLNSCEHTIFFPKNPEWSTPKERTTVMKRLISALDTSTTV